MQKSKESEKKFKITEYINVENRAKELNCEIPTSIAILPRNFENAKTKEELVHESITPTVRKLWRQNNIEETSIEKKGEKIPLIVEESAEQITLPIIFVGELLKYNPELIKQAIDIIIVYLKTTLLKSQSRNVKFKIITKITKKNKESEYKEMYYEGPPENLIQVLESRKKIDE